MGGSFPVQQKNGYWHNGNVYQYIDDKYVTKESGFSSDKIKKVCDLMLNENKVMSPKQAKIFFKNLTFASDVKKFLEKGGSRIKPLDADGLCTCIKGMTHSSDQIMVLEHLWQYRTSEIVGSEQKKVKKVFTFSSD